MTTTPKSQAEESLGGMYRVGYRVHEILILRGCVRKPLAKRFSIVSRRFVINVYYLSCNNIRWNGIIKHEPGEGVVYLGRVRLIRFRHSVWRCDVAVVELWTEDGPGYAMRRQLFRLIPLYIHYYDSFSL
jgi:hypothetical protein